MSYGPSEAAIYPIIIAYFLYLNKLYTIIKTIIKLYHTDYSNRSDTLSYVGGIIRTLNISIPPIMLILQININFAPRILGLP